MRILSLLRAIPLSFYSKPLYRDVAQNWRGLGFTYLLLVFVLFAIPVAATFSFRASSVTISDPIDFNYMIGQIPGIRIARGEVYVSVGQPYVIHGYDKATGALFDVAIIDTTRPVEEWSRKKCADENDERTCRYPYRLVLGKAAVATPGYPYAGWLLTMMFLRGDRVITNEDARAAVERIVRNKTVLPFVLAPAAIASLWLYRCVQMLGYGFLGLIVAKMRKLPLAYSDTVRLSCVAITPVIALLALEEIVGLSLGNTVHFSLAIGYVVFAVKANAHKKT